MINCNNLLIKSQMILCMFWSQAFGLVWWEMNVYISRFGTESDFIGPRSLHMTRSRFGPDLSPDQFLGTIYKTKFGPDRGTIRI